MANQTSLTTTSCMSPKSVGSGTGQIKLESSSTDSGVNTSASSSSSSSSSPVPPPASSTPNNVKSSSSSSKSTDETPPPPPPPSSSSSSSSSLGQDSGYVRNVNVSIDQVYQHSTSPVGFHHTPNHYAATAAAAAVSSVYGSAQPPPATSSTGSSQQATQHQYHQYINSNMISGLQPQHAPSPPQSQAINLSATQHHAYPGFNSHQQQHQQQHQAPFHSYPGQQQQQASQQCFVQLQSSSSTPSTSLQSHQPLAQHLAGFNSQSASQAWSPNFIVESSNSLG